MNLGGPKHGSQESVIGSLITGRTNPVSILTPLFQEQFQNNTPSSLIGLSVPITVHFLTIT